MPTTRVLVELFRAIASGEIHDAAAIASQICDAEERKGHTSAARRLRSALSSTTTIRRTDDLSRFAPQSTTSPALVPLPVTELMPSVVLTPSARQELDSVMKEWRNRDRLETRKLQPRSRLLFYGPPGCGKSFAARALAAELHLPAFLVRFDAVIGAYLGQTAIQLRQVFQFVERTPCVLLLDELDALGKRRGSPLDVGELDRIVIALMQELEHSKPLGLIVATSNLPKHLDDALWRRFDLALAFRAPTSVVLRSFAKRKASELNVAISSKKIESISRAKSFADAEALIIAAARRQALAEER